MSRKKMALIGVGIIAIIAGMCALSLLVWDDHEALKASLSAFLEQARGTPWALPLVMAAYVVAGMVFFPIILLNLVVAMVFGLWGIFYGLIGVMTNAVFYYGIGVALHKWGGKKWTDHPKIKPIDKKLNSIGLAGMVALHGLPAPPFTVMNIIAGISTVSAATYLTGTFLAMLPGAIARGFVGESLTSILLNPTRESWIYLGFGIVLWIVLVGGAHILLKRFQKEPTEPA